MTRSIIEQQLSDSLEISEDRLPGGTGGWFGRAPAGASSLVDLIFVRLALPD
ncbi:hypothetical protein QMK17_22975 [Rhodococcus sp. G-MC3]|uniref:hypothetical protein n=1 Tax=unclassified Rhodococcus (in: high G+C Gram-positive bacteria) TaxID=192944 RepID=UPI00144625C9|nr:MULTISPECIES: hypothetical protein [unclassified Rhodococcus (in: high G+C Gram-positive bacteria)]MDJ0396186.1 hypothetical protein [Rhodococcus sp. G-MC3]